MISEIKIGEKKEKKKLKAIKNEYKTRFGLYDSDFKILTSIISFWLIKNRKKKRNNNSKFEWKVEKKTIYKIEKN